MAIYDSAVPIDTIEVSAYKIPTDSPEADGTYAWDSTTLVLVEAAAGDRRGLGYTYADTATATLIRDGLAQEVTGRDALDVPGCWEAMVHKIRNLGRPGIVSMAIAGSNGGTRSCRRASSSAMSAGSRSRRVDTAWPNLTNTGPSSCSARRSRTPRAAARRRSNHTAGERKNRKRSGRYRCVART